MRLTKITSKSRAKGVFGIFLLTLAWSIVCVAQTPQTSPTPSPTPKATGVIKLEAFPGGGAADYLARKRSFLIQGSLKENAALVERMKSEPLISRDCYYSSIKATKGLIDWLRNNDCESVYCRKLQLEDVATVPEFQKAKADGLKDLGRDDLALLWLTSYLDKGIRDGFFKQQQTLVKTIIAGSKAKVLSSVMTDSAGLGFFTYVESGTYVISSILPMEIKGKAVGWNCELILKPADLSKEKVVTISKCEKVERAFPSCAVEKTAGAWRSDGTQSFRLVN